MKGNGLLVFKCFLILLLCFYSCNLEGADWKLLSSTDKVKGYFDKESISNPSKGIVRVWMRSYFSEGLIYPFRVPDKMEAVDLLMEVDCYNRMYRHIESIYYLEKGGAFHEKEQKEFMHIPPETSTLERLFEACCGKKEGERQWILYHVLPEPEKNSETLYYFDPQSLKSISPGSFLVYDKMVLTNAKGYILRLFEINCVNKTSKNLKFITYDDMDKEGLLIDKPSLDTISDDEPLYHLYKICCRGKK